MAGLDAIRRDAVRGALPPLRAAYPRLWLAGDEVLLEALAAGGEVEQLPPALLEALFGGMVGLQVALPEVIVEVGDAAKAGEAVGPGLRWEPRWNAGLHDGGQCVRFAPQSPAVGQARPT